MSQGVECSVRASPHTEGTGIGAALGANPVFVLGVMSDRGIKERESN